MKAIKRRILLATLLLLPGLATATEIFDPAAYRGKVVYLDFWASWCSPCLQSFPWMKQLQDTFGRDGLVIVAVNVDHERAAADAFLRKTPPNFKVVYDSENKLFESYQLLGMPTAILFDRSGKQRGRHVGWRTEERSSYEAEIKALLREKAP